MTHSTVYLVQMTQTTNQRNTMNIKNLIEITKMNNTWVAKIWFSGVAHCDFLPIPFTSIATKALIKRTLQEINPNHTIVFV